MAVAKNAPCPCGSGKKYKRCCKNRTSPSIETPQAISSRIQGPILPGIDTNGGSRSVIRWALGAVLLVASVLRFWYLAQLQQNPVPLLTVQEEVFDQYRFMKLAEEFVNSNWLGSTVPFYSPAYSYLIAFLYAFFPRTINTVFVFQITLGLLAIFYLYRCACLLFNNRKTALVVAGIAAVYAPALFYECEILRESVVAYCNLFGFYFLLKGWSKNKLKYFVLSGVMIGLSMAIRPHALGFLIVPGLLIGKSTARRIRIKRVELFLLGMTLAVLPVMMRNMAVGGKAVISTQGLEAFWAGNAYDSVGAGFYQLPTELKLEEESKGSLVKGLQILLREVDKHPREYATLYGRKMKMFFNGYEIPANLSFDLFRENMVPLQLGIDFAVVAPLALLGLILLAGRFPGSQWFYGFLAVLSLSVILFHIQGRYRMAAIPFFLLSAGYACYWLIYQVRRRRGAAFFCGFLVLMGASLYTKPDEAFIEKYFGSRIRNIDYGNWAKAYLAKANREGATPEEKKVFLEEALRNYAKAAKLTAGFPLYLIRWGDVLVLQGKPDEAIERYREASKEDPSSVEAHIRWGQVLERKGDLEGAIFQYTEAMHHLSETLRLNPNDEIAQHNLKALQNKLHLISLNPPRNSG